MFAFLELTPWFKKLKRHASLEFCVHLDMSQIGIVCFTKRCLGIQLKFSFFIVLKSFSQVSSDSEFLKSQTSFCKTGDSDLTVIYSKLSNDI